MSLSFFPSYRHVARKWIPMLFMGTCLLYCARMAMPICAVSMATSFHWSKIDCGIVLGGFFWGYCFTQILGGLASDKMGGERVLFMSAASWSIITAVTPLLAKLGSHNLAFMTLARFLMGLLQGVFFPSLTSLCSQRVVEGERGFLMSTMNSGGLLGTLLAGGMGSLMLDWFGWESIFYCTGVLSGLWALIIWLITSQWSLSRTRWLNYFKEPAVWAMIIAHMCISSSGYTLLSWLPTYFKESFPHAKGWVYNVIPWLVAIPSSFCGGYLSDFFIKEGIKHRISFAMGLSSMFIVLLSGAVSFPSAVVFVSAAMGLTTFNCGYVGLSKKRFSLFWHGSETPLFFVVCCLGLLMVSLSGYLIEVTLSWTWMFSFITLVNATGLVIYLIFGEARRVDLEDHSKLIVI
uniref:Solute carrier family 17 member 9a n=1 Tax=Labrus bergylta TaxID=56723 RepID=A0A3Q3FHL5_9LABR